MILQNVDVCFQKNEAGLPIFVVGEAEGKGIQELVEFDFAYF